jgi:predicted  nucleic acid-binding Zn-ribbon protein
VTSLETSVEKYQRQVDRIESTIKELNLFLKGKSSLTDELQNLLGGLKDLDINKLTGELNEVEKSAKALNRTIQNKKDKQKRR